MINVDSSRPEILFPLFASISTLTGVGPKIKFAYEKLKIFRNRDLLFSLPIDHKLRIELETVENKKIPLFVIVEVNILSHSQAGKRSPVRVEVIDEKVSFELVFFNVGLAQVKKLLPLNQKRVISGRLDQFSSKIQIVNPDYIVSKGNIKQIPRIEPVYPLTRGLSQKKIILNINECIKKVPKLNEWVRPDLIKKYGWPTFHDAICKIHSPNSTADLNRFSVARNRLAYDELFAHQVSLALARQLFKRERGVAIKTDETLVETVLKLIPFDLTEAQGRAITEIFEDLGSPLRMNRLLQGDVGSGKTIVAILGMIKIVEFGGQAAFLAPTDILARQHFLKISELIKKLEIQVTLLTGRENKRTKEMKLIDIKSGKSQIIVGTHALFQERVVYKNLRIAVIDEQHRFGVKQRLSLRQKGYLCDILVMTATPIPRSLSLAHYGDMDFSILDEKPKSRKPIRTAVKPLSSLSSVLERLEVSFQTGNRVYWVCPLVEQSEKLKLMSAEDRFSFLKQRFSGVSIGLVHGQMPNHEKDRVMRHFAEGQIQLLVSTTVIEVGVDVPEASIMIIESAERFGLAQLHQLRGRVGRGKQKSSCILLYNGSLGKTSKARLNILRKTEDGFMISEKDLQIRGAGDVLGVTQSGMPEYRLASPENQTALMKLAQDDSRLFLKSDPMLLSERGIAIRNLMHLMDFDEALHYIKAG